MFAEYLAVLIHNESPEYESEKDACNNIHRAIASVIEAIGHQNKYDCCEKYNGHLFSYSVLLAGFILVIFSPENFEFVLQIYENTHDISRNIGCDEQTRRQVIWLEFTLKYRYGT